MNYLKIDPVITNWTKEHRFSLFTGYENHPDTEIRTVYLSSEQGECCQIWIDKPNLGKVCVHAGDVESFQNEELEKEWCVPVDELAKALETAVSFVENWFGRKST